MDSCENRNEKLMFFTLPTFVPKSKVLFFIGNLVEKQNGWLRIAVLFSLKSLAMSSLPSLLHRRTLDLGLLANENSQQFHKLLFHHLHETINVVVRGRQGDFCVYLGIDY